MDEYSMSDGLRARSGVESREGTGMGAIGNAIKGGVTMTQLIINAVLEAASAMKIRSTMTETGIELQGGRLFHVGIGLDISVNSGNLVIRPVSPDEKNSALYYSAEILFPIVNKQRVLVIDLTPMADLADDEIASRIGRAVKTLIRLLVPNRVDRIPSLDTLEIDLPIGHLWNAAWKSGTDATAEYVRGELHRAVDTLVNTSDCDVHLRAKALLLNLLGYDPERKLLHNLDNLTGEIALLKARIDNHPRLTWLREKSHGLAGEAMINAIMNSMALTDTIVMWDGKETTMTKEANMDVVFNDKEFADELVAQLPIHWVAEADNGLVIATCAELGLGLRVEMASDTIVIGAGPIAVNGDAIGWDASGHVALAHMLFPESISINVRPTGSQIPAVGQLIWQGEEWVVVSKEYLLASQLVEVLGNVLEAGRVRYDSVYVLRDLTAQMGSARLMSELPTGGNSWASLYEGVRRADVVREVERAYKARVERAIAVVTTGEELPLVVRNRVTNPLYYLLEGSDPERLKGIVEGTITPKPDFGEVVREQPRYSQSFDWVLARIQNAVASILVKNDRDPRLSTEERIRTALTTNYLGRYGVDRHDGEVLIVADPRPVRGELSGKAERTRVREVMSFLPRFYREKELRVEMSGGESVIARVKLGTPRLPFAQARAASLANALGKSQHVTLTTRKNIGVTTLDAGGGRTMSAPLVLTRLTRQTFGAHKRLNNEGGIIRYGVFDITARRTVTWFGEFTPNGQPGDWKKAVGMHLEPHTGQVRVGTDTEGGPVTDVAFGLAKIVDATIEIDEATGAERRKVTVESDGQLPDGMKLFVGGTKVTTRVVEASLDDFLYEDGTTTKADVVVALDKAMGKHWDIRSAIPNLLYTWGLKSESWVRRHFDFDQDWMEGNKLVAGTDDLAHVEAICRLVCQKAGIERSQLPVTVGNGWVELPLPVVADSHIPAYTCTVGRRVVSTHPGVSMTGAFRHIYHDAVANGAVALEQYAAWLTGEWWLEDDEVTLTSGTRFKVRRPTRVLEFTREGGTFMDPNQEGAYRLRKTADGWSSTDLQGNVILPSARLEGAGLTDTILDDLADDECWVIPADKGGDESLIRGKGKDTGMELKPNWGSNYLVVFPEMAKAIRATTRPHGRLVSASRIVTELNGLVEAGMFMKGKPGELYGEGSPGNWQFLQPKIDRLVKNLIVDTGTKSLKALALKEIHDLLTPKLPGARVVLDMDHHVGVDEVAIDPAWLDECLRQEAWDDKHREEDDWTEKKSRVARNAFFVKEGDIVLAARYPIEAENGYVALRVVRGHRYMTPSDLPRAVFNPQMGVALMRGDRDGDQAYLMSIGTPGTPLADSVLAEHGIDGLHQRDVAAATAYGLIPPARLSDPGYHPAPKWKPLDPERFSTGEVAAYAATEVSMKRFVAEVTGFTYHEKLRELSPELDHASRTLWSLLVNGAVDKYQDGMGVEAIDVVESLRGNLDPLSREELMPRLVEWSDHDGVTAERNAELAYIAYEEMRKLAAGDSFTAYPMRKAILSIGKAANGGRRTEQVLRFLRRTNLDGKFADRVLEFIKTGSVTPPEVQPHSLVTVVASGCHKRDEEALRVAIREWLVKTGVRGVFTGLRNTAEVIAAEVALELCLGVVVNYPAPGWDSDHSATLKARRAAVKPTVTGYIEPHGKPGFGVTRRAEWYSLTETESLLVIGDTSDESVKRVAVDAEQDNMRVEYIEMTPRVESGQTVVFTGHREFVGDDHGKGEEAQRVRAEIVELLNTHKPSRAILGGSYGADQLALETVLDWRDAGNEIDVTVVFPYDGWGQWHQKQTVRRRDAAIDRGVTVEYALERNMGNNSPTLRDHHMVERGDWIIAIWSGDRWSGTGKTVAYGRECGLPAEVIQVTKVEKEEKKVK